MADKHSMQDLVLIVQVASALSLGALAGLLYSVKAVTPSIEFRFSWATVVAFGLAAAGSLAFWHLTFRLSAVDERAAAAARQPRQTARKVGLLLLTIGLGLALLFAFIYPLKDFSSEKVREIGLGALIAVGFLSVLGFLFWKVVRYMESQQE